MQKTEEKYGAYVQILKEELVPAMGCTQNRLRLLMQRQKREKCLVKCLMR